MKDARDELKICPIILHAELINAQQHVNKENWGYRLTDPKDEFYDNSAQCLGCRCMFYEENDIYGWCGLTKDYDY